MIPFIRPGRYGPKSKFAPGPPLPPRLVISRACVVGLRDCFAPEITKLHESIAYLLGQTDGTTTLAVAAIRPSARTTRGSFAVDAAAMARVVRTAVDLGLQVVGQAHTHPGDAFHSEGDDEGARIAFTGYVSVVLPEYGRHLPSMVGAASFFFVSGKRFVPLDVNAVKLIPGRID